MGLSTRKTRFLIKATKTDGKCSADRLNHNLKFQNVAHAGSVVKSD